jgi:hypothetical protein
MGSRCKDSVLIIFPWLAWTAIATSAALLFMLYSSGTIGRWALVVLVGWFLLAGYCQFFGDSATLQASGVALQTVLAVYLIMRWKVAAS